MNADFIFISPSDYQHKYTTVVGYIAQIQSNHWEYTTLVILFWHNNHI